MKSVGDSHSHSLRMAYQRQSKIPFLSHRAEPFSKLEGRQWRNNPYPTLSHIPYGAETIPAEKVNDNEGRAEISSEKGVKRITPF